MQHLLVRVMFRMNPKAALIQLSKNIKEAEEWVLHRQYHE